MSARAEERAENNASVRLFITVFIVVMVLLIYGYFATHRPETNQVIVPERSATTVRTVPQ